MLVIHNPQMDLLETPYSGSVICRQDDDDDDDAAADAQPHPHPQSLPPVALIYGHAAVAFLCSL